MFSAEDYKGAQQAFEQSYGMSPKPLVLFNIAMCQKAMLQYVDAISTFERFLKDGRGNQREAKLARAEKTLAELNGLVGRLSIRGMPEGARLFINDALVTTLLVDSIKVNPGRHLVAVTKDGFEPFKKSIVVTTGATVEVQAALKVMPKKEPLKPILKDEPTLPLKPHSNALLIAGLVTSGLGLVGIGVGSYFVYERENTDLQDARNAVTETEYNTVELSAKRHEVGGYVGFISAGAFLVTGTVLLILDAKKRKETKVVLAPTIGGARILF